MKALIMALAIGISSLSYASGITYHDPDTHLQVQIPEGFKKTWELTHHELKFDFLVFNTDEENEEVSLVGLSKLDLGDQDLEEINIGLLAPTVLEQIEDVLWGFVCSSDFFYDLDFEIYQTTPKTSSEVPCLAFRVEFTNENEWDEEERVGQADFHVFIANGYISTVVTARVTSDEDVSLSGEIDDLTEEVLKTVVFLEDSDEIDDLTEEVLQTEVMPEEIPMNEECANCGCGCNN